MSGTTRAFTRLRKVEQVEVLLVTVAEGAGSGSDPTRDVTYICARKPSVICDDQYEIIGELYADPDGARG